MSDFDTAVNFVLRNEGGLNESKHDRGGITNFGISLRFLSTLSSDTLKLYGIYEEVTDETIKNLTIEQAKLIYKGEFWAHAPFGKILNQEYANYIFDMSVNMGIAPAIKCTQRATWAVLKKWDILPDDGILGDKTLAAIQQCGFMIMPALRAERGAYYRAIISAYPEQIENLHNWYNRTYCSG
jgi:lysozyme family protein